MTVGKFAQALTTIALLSLMAAAYASNPYHLKGKIIRVVDGDTVVVEAEDKRYRVRLAGIDAPERNQPWGEASTRELRRQVAGEYVTVVWRKKDRWKRLIGVVKLEGEDQNLHMVDRGLAWHFKRYQKEQAPADRKAYSAAATAAQGARRGLWSDPQPIPPWEWRKQ